MSQFLGWFGRIVLNDDNGLYIHSGTKGSKIKAKEEEEGCLPIIEAAEMTGAIMGYNL